MFNSELFGLYRHIKTGGLYLLLGDCLIESDKTLAVIYRSMSDGQVWVRPTKEFFDGRFEFIDSANGDRQLMESKG
jgi:hypothetical protein